MENSVKRGFKRKTIIKTIREKINEWLETIEDKGLRERVRSNYILTGGAIASMLQGELPNDYDVYLRDENTAIELCNYYLDKYLKEYAKNERIDRISVQATDLGVRIVIQSAGIAELGNDTKDYQYFESFPPEDLEKYFDKWNKIKNGDYTPAMYSSNAITLHGGIQIVLRFVGPPEEIHKYYDFVHCTNWYTEREGLVLNQPALESIMAKELRYIGSLYPICSMFRIRKFVKRGWSITAGEMLKIAWDINNLNLKNTDVLRNQLTGVDVAYFHQVLRALESKRDIDRAYLFEVVNRVFDEADDDSV